MKEKLYKQNYEDTLLIVDIIILY